MLKFSFRNKQFYPLMLLLFIFLRICLDKILTFHPYKGNIDFILPFLIFSSQSLIGYLVYLHYSKKNSGKEVTISKIFSLNIKYDRTITSIKSSKNSARKKKKLVLLFFASFFNFIGCIIRSDDVVNFGTKEENNSLLEIRVRSIQIIISSLLCYYTLRLNIYNHQKLSLIIISFFLFVLIIIELYISTNILYKILAFLLSTTSCLFRSFLDVSEKYLLDFEFVDIIKILIYEGLIGVFFYIFYFISNKAYLIQSKNILNQMSELGWPFASFILLIIIYIFISGFRNAYRVTTNKYYSPMSRALFESTLDPLLFLYNTLTFNRKGEYIGYWIYFSIVLFCLTIIAFFSLVYNDFIILYCCGLQHNTYSEIISRLYFQQSNKNGSIFENNQGSFDNSGEKESVVIELKDQYLIQLKG